MNREIEFRGKCAMGNCPDAQRGEWLYGDLTKSDDGDVAWVKSWHVDPATVGQFTGLKDANCKKIYEGDIVRHETYGKAHDGEVVFEDGAFVVNSLAYLHCDRYLGEHTSEGLITIIGNIHYEDGGAK